MLGIDVAAAGFILAALTFGVHSVQAVTKEAHNNGIRSARLEAELGLLKSDLMSSLNLLTYRLGQVEKSIHDFKETP